MASTQARDVAQLQIIIAENLFNQSISVVEQRGGQSIEPYIALPIASFSAGCEPGVP